MIDHDEPLPFYAAALRVRRDPAGIVALKGDDADGLQRVARLHLRDLAGDAALSAMNVRHVIELSKAMGPAELAPAPVEPPKAGPRVWQPEPCRAKGVCDERVGQGGWCLVCKARRKRPRAKSPAYSDELALRARQSRKARVAYVIDGVGYSWHGKPIGQIQVKPRALVTRKFGVPQPRFRKGDEIGTFTIQWENNKGNILVKLKDFCGITSEELSVLLSTSRAQVDFWVRGKHALPLGAYTRNVLRKLIESKFALGAEIMADLDALEAQYEAELRGDSPQPEKKST